MTEDREATLVVGAGLAGLACGHALRRLGHSVRVLEAAPRPGGVVGTIEREGFVFETGPNTVLPSAKTFRALCGELGLAERLIPSRAEAGKRYLFHRGRLVTVPQSPLAFLTSPLLSLGSKAKILSEPLRKSRLTVDASATEPSLGTLLDERIGKEATELLAAAFVRGIYAGDVYRLGARSAFPRLWQLVRDHGSLLRGALATKRARRDEAPPPGPVIPRGRLVSFPGGLQELVDSLAGALGDSLSTGCTVTGIEKLAGDKQGFRVRRVDGPDIKTGKIVLAVPAPVAARLLEPLVDPSALESLHTIPHATLCVGHVGLAPGTLDPPPEGFGFLVPPAAGPAAPRCLGMIYSSNLFSGRAPRGAFSAAGFYRASDVPGGARDVATLVCEDLARALDLAEPPCAAVTHGIDWQNVIPQYEIGHAERVAALQSALSQRAPGLFLAGAWVGGVSVDDVLARGRAVAAEVVEMDEEEHA